MIELGGKMKGDIDVIFLSLVLRDDFYYEKPYDRDSNCYLLLRFIGDLCSDIMLLYDGKIEK